MKYLSISRRWALLGTAAAFSAHPLPPAAQTRSKLLLRRGINLHHLLNWPATRSRSGRVDYVWPAFQGANFSITDEELRRLVSAGFDFIRLTVDPSIFIAGGRDHVPALSANLLSVVQRLIGAGFRVIVDLHPVAVNPDYAPAELVREGMVAKFSEFADLVQHIAELLRDVPHDKVALELMNEPLIFGTEKAELRRWQDMLETLHRRARQGAPALPLVLTGAQSSYRKALFLLDLTAFRSSDVIYTFHFYEPFAFTHQGVPRIDPQFIAGLAWPEKDANADEVLERAGRLAAGSAAIDPAARGRAGAATMRLIDDYKRQRYDGAKIDRSFDEVAAWAAGNAIAPGQILVGEFGCVDAAGGIPTGADRLKWLRAVGSNCERLGFPWAYWAYKGNGGMQLLDGAGSLDPETLAALGLPPSR